MATGLGAAPKTQEQRDREAIVAAGGQFATGAKKLGAAAADVFTLRVRGVMGAANTLLRAPNAFGAGIPYIPEAVFGGSSSSMTPYFDRVANTGGASGSWGAPATPTAVAPARSTAAAPARPSVAPPVTPVTPTAAAGAPSLVVEGAFSPPRAAAPGIGAQLVAGPATPSVSSSRDANGNLVITNAPGNMGAVSSRTSVSPAQGAILVAPVRDTFENKAKPGSLASFFGASMNEKKLATEEAQNMAFAQTQANRNVETNKINATLSAATQQRAPSAKESYEAALLGERLAAARGAATPEERNALLTGSAPSTASPYRFIPGMNPGEVIAGNAQTGAVTIQQAQPPAQQLREGQTGTMLNAKGERVPSVVRNGVPVPI